MATCARLFELTLAGASLAGCFLHLPDRADPVTTDGEAVASGGAAESLLVGTIEPDPADSGTPLAPKCSPQAPVGTAPSWQAPPARVTSCSYAELDLAASCAVSGFAATQCSAVTPSCYSCTLQASRGSDGTYRELAAEAWCIATAFGDETCARQVAHASWCSAAACSRCSGADRDGCQQAAQISTCAAPCRDAYRSACSGASPRDAARNRIRVMCG